QDVQKAYSHAYAMDHYEGRADFKNILGEKNTLDYGIGLLFYKLDRGNVVPYGSASLRVPVTLGEEQGLESDVYITDDFNVLPWINVNAGFRFALFTALGPKTVYTYT